MTISRRFFFSGLAALAVTAPAIVRAGSLMPVHLPVDLRSAVSMHEITEYCGNDAAAQLDVLYGSLPINPAWTLQDYTEKILIPEMERYSAKQKTAFDEMADLAFFDGKQWNLPFVKMPEWRLKLPKDYLLSNGR